MPKLDITELDRELKQGKFRPVYVIVGEEHHLALGALRRIRETIGAGVDDSISTKVLSGREARPEAVFGALKTSSMFGGRPLVIVRDGQSMPKDTMEALADYCAKPVESSTLVVVAEKLDGRTKFMLAAQKCGAVMECKPLYMDKVPAWINMEVKRAGRNISQEAAQFLAEMVGSELGQLSQSIERIILFVGDKKTIELKDVEDVVTETHQHTIFELTDAVGTKNLTKTISLLHNLLENGESPIMVLTMLARHFRMLAKAKDIVGRTSDKVELARYIGVNPYFVNNYISQSKNFAGNELRKGFRVLHRCDRELKSSRVPKERILEKALFELIRR